MRMFRRDPRGQAMLADVPLVEVLERAVVRSPAYVYDIEAMVEQARQLRAGFGTHDHLVAYAVKANSAGPVVRALSEAGCGAEVGSWAELEIALSCGISPDDILFNGVAKSDEELDRAIGCGSAGVAALVVDAVEELKRVAARADAVGRSARVALRLNPGVMADTHEHIATGHDEAKFGIPLRERQAALSELDKLGQLRLVGFGIHIGSQLVRTNEYLGAAERLLDVTGQYEQGAGRELPIVNFGGGFGIDYGDGGVAPPCDFAQGVVELASKAGLGRRRLVVEPGRALVGAHGVLIARVVCRKRVGERNWLVIDAGMNDLLRPALYQARHRIEPLESHPAGPGEGSEWHVVGPVCESSCEFGRHRFVDPLPERVVIRDCGAYGYTMASHYNGRALPAEVFVFGDGRVAACVVGDAREWAAERVRCGTTG